MKGLEKYSYIRWGEIYDEAKKISDLDFKLYRSIGLGCSTISLFFLVIPLSLKFIFDRESDDSIYFWIGAVFLLIGIFGLWQVYLSRKNLIRVVQCKIIAKEVWKDRTVKSGKPTLLFRFRIVNESVAALYPDGIWNEIVLSENSLNTPILGAISVSKKLFDTYDFQDTLIYLLSPQNDLMAIVPKNSEKGIDFSTNLFYPFEFFSENAVITNGEKVFLTKTISLDSDESVYQFELIERLDQEKKS
ncbi:MAG: hypothetical protein SFU91_08760 [Chloroherpetonaceae bacterium]|nr:hypothetical protein [Chloroherpetonaceae bacterium]